MVVKNRQARQGPTGTGVRSRTLSQAGPSPSCGTHERLGEDDGDASGAKGALTGDRYHESLNDGREVWLAGGRVKNVAEHPAFRSSVDEFARVLDLRLADERAREVNFYTSPETGNLLSRSYLAPATAKELHAKFETTRWWMAEILGQHGRAPDFMANVVVALYDYRDELEKNRPGFGQSAEGYYRFARGHDLVLTHALGDPQIDRSASAIDDPDLALRVVEERADGVVIRGAKQLATLAPAPACYAPTTAPRSTSGSAS